MYSFYDVDPEMLDTEDTQYYHNVCLTLVGVSREYWNKVEELQDIKQISYLDELTSPQPNAVYMYVSDKIGRDYDFEIFNYPHSIVAVQNNGNITWYDGRGNGQETNPWEY